MSDSRIIRDPHASPEGRVAMDVAERDALLKHRAVLRCFRSREPMPAGDPYSPGGTQVDLSELADDVVAAIGSGGGGGTPSATVVAETTYGQTPSPGVAATFSRGDHTHGSPPNVRLVSQINGELTSIVFGMPVALTGSDTVKKALATTQTLARVLGLVAEASIGSTLVGIIQANGVLTGTTAQWDVVTGSVGGLIPDALYWLDPTTPGRLTTSAPPESIPGKFVTLVGQALSSMALEIRVEPPILL